MQHIKLIQQMTTIFPVRLYGRLIDIKSNLRTKEFYITNQGCNSLEGSFSNRNNIRAPV